MSTNVNPQKNPKEKSAEDQAEDEISDLEEMEEKDEEDDEKEEEIIDLDDLAEEEADLNKRNSKKDDIIMQNITNEKENLNTQITAEATNERERRNEPLNLNNLDVNIVPIEEIVNFLLNSKELFGSFSTNDIKTPKCPDNLSKKINHKYKNIESTFKQAKIKPNYILSGSMNNPEMTYDFNTAWNRVIKKAVDDKIVDNSMKLLVTKKHIKKSRNLDATKRENISTKVDFYVNKKTKTIEVYCSLI